jgi:hypothetical protein
MLIIFYLTLYIFFQNHCTILLGPVYSEYESGNSNKCGPGTMRCGYNCIAANAKNSRTYSKKSFRHYKLPS